MGEKYEVLVYGATLGSFRQELYHSSRQETPANAMTIAHKWEVDLAYRDGSYSREGGFNVTTSNNFFFRSPGEDICDRFGKIKSMILRGEDKDSLIMARDEIWETHGKVRIRGSIEGLEETL